MIINIDEYVTPSGQICSIQYDETKGVWEVAMWNEDDSNQWYLMFWNEEEARQEYERWRR